MFGAAAKRSSADSLHVVAEQRADDAVDGAGLLGDVAFPTASEAEGTADIEQWIADVRQQSECITAAAFSARKQRLQRHQQEQQKEHEHRGPRTPVHRSLVHVDVKTLGRHRLVLDEKEDQQ